MTEKDIYLDNSATSPPLPSVIDKVNEVLKYNYGNPSSLHNKGLKAEKIKKEACKKLIEKLNTSTNNFIFTSGGTESNNLAIKGIAYKYQNRGKHLITSLIEHPSVLNTFRYLEDKGFKVTYLKPDRWGIINPEKLKNALKENTILVSIMHVNNELGSIQPIKQMAKFIKELNPSPIFHVDAVQSFGKIRLNPKKMGIDLLTISAHKVHGPKGIGALYYNDSLQLEPLLHGGGQEKGIRSGTENMPGIAGFIPAIEALPNFSKNNFQDKKINKIKKYLIEKFKNNQNNLPEFRINTPLKCSAPHIINISFAGLKGEVIVHSLESDGIYVSTGSACHSRKNEQSEVLKAIGLAAKYKEGTIRISLSRHITKKEIDVFLKSLIKNLEFIS
ncbi:MAG: cysteine desulfurase family protein [Halanaerobiales bacterium]